MAITITSTIITSNNRNANDFAFPAYFSLAWFVRLSVCRLSHSCTLLEPFGGFRGHLAGTLVSDGGA